MCNIVFYAKDYFFEYIASIGNAYYFILLNNYCTYIENTSNSEEKKINRKHKNAQTYGWVPILLSVLFSQSAIIFNHLRVKFQNTGGKRILF